MVGFLLLFNVDILGFQLRLGFRLRTKLSFGVGLGVPLAFVVRLKQLVLRLAFTLALAALLFSYKSKFRCSTFLMNFTRSYDGYSARSFARKCILL